MIEALAGPWSKLASPEAYPEDPSAADGAEWIQTHLSHVYRTGALVYKFRKGVDLGFVHFEEREERNADCLREVTLNRRMAPDVYQGVAPLLGTDDAPRVGPVGEALVHDEAGAELEHCVVMRRLPDDRDTLSLLERGLLTTAHVDALAERVAAFHASHGLGEPAPFSREEWLARCTEPSEENFRVLAEAPGIAPPGLLELAQGRTRAFASEQAERFERRRLAGRAVDGHGDLHLQHAWFERDDAPPIVIDCLEFEERLRLIDAAAEVAFPAMDLRYRGRGDLAERFLALYARESDDFDLYSVVDYFVAYRAGVRAKVASLAARDAGIDAEQRAGAAESTERHLALAAEALAPRPPGALVLTAGIVGTGKSTVAAALAERLDAVVLASDRVRKRLLGIAPGERAGRERDAGAYAPERIAEVYAALLERARPVLASGRVAILDATYSLRARRDEARALAAELGCPVFLVETCAAEESARKRLAERSLRGADPSDAGPEAYDPSVRGFEPPDEWPEPARARVQTDQEGWQQTLAALVARIVPPPD